MEEKLTFDDVQIIPKYSDITSRSLVSLETQFTRRYRIEIPLVAAPMDTVCETAMACKMWEAGGVGIIHRFCTIEQQSEMVADVVQYISNYVYGDVNQLDLFPNSSTSESLKMKSPVIAAAVGANGDSIERSKALINAGANVLLIDVAHGHHANVKHAIEQLIEFREKIGKQFDIIAGNVATYDGAEYLYKAGVDAIRVGVGGGSVCETRIRTGVGYPQLASIIDISTPRTISHSCPIISDGGIRYPGDVAKALAAGASTVMIGSLFAGTIEAPGEVYLSGSWPSIKQYKMYRGSASASIKMQKSGHTNHVEGASKMIPLKGAVTTVISDLTDGLKSSMSYVGASDLNTFQQRADFVKITNAGMREALPHLLYDNT